MDALKKPALISLYVHRASPTDLKNNSQRHRTDPEAVAHHISNLDTSDLESFRRIGFRPFYHRGGKKKNLFAADMVLFHEPGLNGLDRKLILKANNCQNKTTLNRNGSLLAGILQVSTGGV